MNSNVAQHIIIVAAGLGSRFGAPVPKQFCLLAGRPVLIHTIENVRRAIPGASLTLVLSPQWLDYWLDLCREFGMQSPRYVFGGAARFHSVKAAIDLISPSAADGDIVYVHDAARPLLSQEVARRLREAVEVEGYIGAVPVIPLADSIRHISGPDCSVAVNRSEYRAVQTPQSFRFGTLRRAYDCDFRPEFTDDASVVEHHTGRHVAMVEGSPDLMKITTARDLDFVAAILAARQ